jgi:hypothetical protein
MNSELHVQEKQSSHNNCAVKKEKEKMESVSILARTETDGCRKRGHHLIFFSYRTAVKSGEYLPIRTFDQG